VFWSPKSHYLRHITNLLRNQTPPNYGSPQDECVPETRTQSGTRLLYRITLYWMLMLINL
jgi:hypothetical protein